jgi:hypothetical protein
MREGRLRTGLRVAVSMAIGLSLALTANYLALAQPGQTSPARDPDSAPPYPLEGEAVSKPPAALATPVCTENSNTHVVMVKPAEDRI